MKRNIVKSVSASLLIMALLSSEVAAVHSKDNGTDNNLYYKALRAYVEGGSVESKGQNLGRDYCNLLVRKEDWFKEPLPSQVGKCKVTFVTMDELAILYKKTKVEIPLTVMRPIQNEGSTIIIGFLEYWFSYEKKGRRENYRYALEAGGEVKLKYDVTREQFTVISIAMRGI